MSTKKEAILRATRDLILEHGLQSVSMSQIGKKAGVGMGTIYNYFPTKEDLVNSLFDTLAKAFSDATLSNFDDKAPLMNRFRQLCSQLILYGRDYPHDLLLFSQLNHAPIIQPEIQDYDHGIKATFFHLVEEAQALGVVKPLPAVLLGNMQISFATAIVRSHQLNGTPINDDLIEQVTAAWVDLLTT